MKILNPEMFMDKIEERLSNVVHEMPKPKEGETPKSPLESMEVWLQILESYDQSRPYIPPLHKYLDNLMKTGKMIWDDTDKREPFCSISHNDLWVNNCMQTFSGQQMQKNKFVDFQVYLYDSTPNDVIFYIWTSVQTSTIQEHFDALLKHYFNNFLAVLQELDCDTNEFTYEKFDDECRLSTAKQIFHFFLIIRAVLARKGEFAMDMSDIDKMEVKADNINQLMRERAVKVIEICGKRGWL